MKLEYYLFVFFIAGIVAYYNFFPKVKTETKIEYIKGDTTTITETKIVKIPKTVYKAKIDTFIVKDTVYQGYSSNFNIGNPVAFAVGKVSFYNQKFEFSNVEIKYPRITKTVVDTIKTINYITRNVLFSSGVQIGVGYDLLNSKVGLFVGYGIQIRLDALFGSK